MYVSTSPLDTNLEIDLHKTIVVALFLNIIMGFLKYSSVFNERVRARVVQNLSHFAVV